MYDFAEARVGAGYYSGRLHERVGGDDFLNLFGEDLLAGYVDHGVAAANDRDVAFAIAAALCSGPILLHRCGLVRLTPRRKQRDDRSHRHQPAADPEESRRPDRVEGWVSGKQQRPHAA